MKKQVEVKVKGKGKVTLPSPWKCVWCTEAIETPEELGRNPANLPVHQKCLPKMQEADAAGKFTPRTESISENGDEEALE